MKGFTFSFCLGLSLLPATALAVRKMNFTQVYGTVGECGMATYLFNITNVSALDQSVKVKGGMQVLLILPGSAGIGITSEGMFVSGTYLRGTSGTGVTDVVQAPAVPRLSGPGCIGALLCGGVGADRAPTGSTIMTNDGPSFKLAPGASAFLQSNRYGSSAHGIFTYEVVVTEDRGALVASGVMGTWHLPCSDGIPVSGTETNTAVPINAGRPF